MDENRLGRINPWDKDKMPEPKGNSCVTNPSTFSGETDVSVKPVLLYGPSMNTLRRCAPGVDRETRWGEGDRGMVDQAKGQRVQ